MMNSKTARQGGFLRIDAMGIGVCVLVSLLWYAITISPLLKQRAVVAQSHREIEAQERKAQQTREAMASAQRQLAVVRDELSVSGVQLDSAAQINKRIAVLTEFFADCNLHIDDVQTGRICTGLQCDLVPITIVGRGAYPQCVRFLGRLCSTFADMSVMRIEFKGTGARTVEPEQFRFELFWYAAPRSAVQNPPPKEVAALIASASRTHTE